MKLSKVVRDKGISFPVMIDKPLQDKPYWGKTFMKYRIWSIPSEARINEEGHISEIDKPYIDKGSDWVKNPSQGSHGDVQR